MIVWHFTQIVCELYSLPGSPNINKAAIYDALAARYKSFLMRIDDRLAQLMPKIGVQVLLHIHRPPCTILIETGNDGIDYGLF